MPLCTSISPPSIKVDFNSVEASLVEIACLNMLFILHLIRTVIVVCQLKINNIARWAQFNNKKVGPLTITQSMVEIMVSTIGLIL